MYGARTGEVPEAKVCKCCDEAVIKTPSSPLPRPRRKMFRQLPYGFVPGIFPFARDSNHVPTQVDALARRLCRELPPIDDNELISLGAYVTQWCKDNLEPIAPGGLMTFEEWLTSTTYPEHRKVELRKVYCELHGAVPSKKRASKVKAFIKSESMIVAQVLKSARWICSRTDASKVALGPIFKSIERVVYRDHHFVKHTPVPERPALVAALKTAGAKFIVTDFTAFEASFRDKIIRAVEGRVYEYMLQWYPELAKFVVDTLTGENDISTRQGVRVKIHGRRMSGDMCTSLGNGLTNLLLMGYVCNKLGTTWDGLVEGDDGIFALYGPLPQPLHFAALGFDIKLAEIRDPSLGGFCGIVGSEGQVLRDPMRFLQTFGWTTNSIEGGRKVMMGLLRSKALSALYETPACPLVSAIAARALELSLGFEPRWEHDGYHFPPPPSFLPSVREISPGNRDLFSELYGVSVETQIKAEAMIKTATDLQFLESMLPVHPNHSLIGNWFVGP